MKGLRRSFLFIPGNNPGMVQTADLFDADCVIFDLEDAVSLTEKDSARALLQSAFKTFKFSNCETMVRINGLDTLFYQDDIKACVDMNLDYILLPKATVAGVLQLDTILDSLKSDIEIYAIIESAEALETAINIAKSCKRLKGMLLGGEDLTADIGTIRTKKGVEIQYARNKFATSCKAAGIVAIDTPYTDVVDESELEFDILEGKRYGMTAKASISPRHIDMIHHCYAPSEREVIYAMRVLKAVDVAEAKGLGVFSLDGKMIDAPIIKRAKGIYTMAKRIGQGYKEVLGEN